MKGTLVPKKKVQSQICSNLMVTAVNCSEGSLAPSTGPLLLSKGGSEWLEARLRD